jgi:hypothetical protein
MFEKNVWVAALKTDFAQSVGMICRGNDINLEQL